MFWQALPQQLAQSLGGRQNRRMARVIAPSEFQARDTVRLARGLLGKVLVRMTTHGRVEQVISEVEAYDGERDRACHASKGRTARTEVMYRCGGCWYIYLCYGVHEMLNLVTGPDGYPAAILLRGVGDIQGPGRLTHRLEIDRRLNGSVAQPDCGLHLEDHGLEIPRRRISASPRIGVDYAGPVWSAKPWRFTVDPEWLGKRIGGVIGQNCMGTRRHRRVIDREEGVPAPNQAHIVPR